MKTRILTGATAGLLLAATAASAVAQEGTQVELTVANSPDHGDYIADGDGRALYMFEADRRGKAEAAASSTCYDACADAWPPLIAEGDPSGSERINTERIDTIQRRNGRTQVSYAGWPLYYYAKDQDAGQTTGHDVEGFGGEWYLVAPSGDPVGYHAPGGDPEGTTDTSN